MKTTRQKPDILYIDKKLNMLNLFLNQQGISKIQHKIWVVVLHNKSMVVRHIKFF